MPRFSIVIVTWNALSHLKTYLPSVAATEHDSYEIVIADNHSTDGTASWVRNHYPEARLARFDDNYGYCGGNNRAVPYTKGEILIFLNNDVAVEPDWLDALDRAFRERPETAALQPKIRSYREPRQFEYAGAAGGHLDRYGYPFCRGRIFDMVEEDRGQYDQPAPVFWASGAALAVRRDCFGEAGGFDEDFEFHMDEIDLCWRLWRRGWEVRCEPGSVVYHLGGGSLPMDSPRKVYYNYRNSLFMLWKNYSTAALCTRLPVRVGLDKIAALRALLQGNTREFGAIVRAYRDFLGQLAHVHRKRRDLRAAGLPTADPPVLQPFSVVWSYFVSGRRTYADLPTSRPGS
ncbi:MAG: glycosyltransferase family 2 protein [Balneolaceae bacterium]|nr:glycosyltransferase family 2 protein [Balneolaceae bacterium]